MKFRLKQLRLEKGMSQNALGKELNVTHATIYRWENLIRKPRIQTLVTLSRYFDVSVDYLVGISEERQRKKHI